MKEWWTHFIWRVRMQKIELVIAVLGICAIGAIFYVVLKAALA